MIDDIIQLAHDLRQQPALSVVETMDQWDRLLTSSVNANFTVLWVKRKDFLETLFASGKMALDVTLDPRRSLAGHVLHSKDTLRFDLLDIKGSNLDSHPEIVASFNVESALLAPIFVDGEVSGVFGIYFEAGFASKDIGTHFLLPIVDFISDFLSRHSLQSKLNPDNGLLYASATALNALVSAMSHYHELSHSNIAARNSNGKAYRMTEELKPDNLRAKQIELLANLEKLDEHLRGSGAALEYIKQSYLSSSEKTRNDEKIRLQDLSAQILAKFEPLSVKREVELAINLGDGLLVSDRRKVDAILENLLRNSFDFVQPLVKSRKVKLSQVLEGNLVRFEIEDNGIGMSEEALARATEPFFSTRESDGIGLFVVNGFTKELGGTLTIESELGQGTKVIVELPGAEI